MRRRRIPQTPLAAALAALIGAAVLLAAPAAPPAAKDKAARQALTKKLWAPGRVEAAIKAVEKQRRDGLLTDRAYAKRKEMLAARRAGRYVPQSLSVTDPPVNFIQNGGFEKINRNSARNRSRWLWWGGWSWGGDYENSWETRREYVHSGTYSARIRCTGAKGRIGISTPGIPVMPGAKEYRLTFWARGEGDNMLFVNYEAGARGVLRKKIEPAWKEYTLVGAVAKDAKTFSLYVYHIGTGTIWLDDMKLVPVGAKAN